MSEHTDLPWSIGYDLPYIVAVTRPPSIMSTAKTTICRGAHTGGQNWPALDRTIYEANAEFICQAVNSHYDLLAALKNYVGMYAILPCDRDKPHMQCWIDCEEQAKAAIAKAERSTDET